MNQLTMASMYRRQQYHNSSTMPTTTTTKRVIVAGAGPAGILAAIQLLRRNDSNNVTYHVTLVDAGRDYGTLTDEERSSHRSWMIGLSNHGLTAIREVPGLYEDYVKEIGIELDSFSVFLGTNEMKQTSEEMGQVGDNLIVDRNYVVSSLARFLNDKFGKDAAALSTLYHTKIMYVDGDNQRVLVRNTTTNKEEYVDYDILLGCDGIRSVVRNAMVTHHRDFECTVSDIFARFKATHIALPKTLDSKSVSLLPGFLPKVNGIALPEKGGMLNLTGGYTLNDPCDEELASDDPAVVAEYLKKHLKAFELVDYDDFAQQWVNQSWNSTGQVHCNYYHSDKLQAIIMGDAAHATSPSIGMGMNTALGDASALNRLLDEHHDDWEAVLPAFSEERVKEGRALTDLAYNLFSHSQSQQLKLVLMGALRTKLAKIFPFIGNDPQYDIGQGEKLSVVYDRATKMGIIPSVRYTNDRIRQEYFERQVGMVTEDKGSSWKIPLLVVATCVAAGAAYLLLSQSGGPQLM